MRFTSYSAFVTDLHRGGIEYAADHAARLGFDSVEFMAVYPTASPLPRRYDAEKTAAILRERGLSVACYSIYADLFSGSDEDFLAAMEEHLAFAAAVGAPFFHHTLAPHSERDGKAVSYDEIFEDIVRRAAEVSRRAAALEITSLYEPQGPFFNGVEGLSRLVEEIAHRTGNAAICGDVGNSLFADCDPVDIFRRFEGKIPHIHVKDYLRSGTEPEGQYAGRSTGGAYLTPCRLGEGVIDLAACFRIFMKQGVLPRVALEFSGDDAAILREMRYLNELESTLRMEMIKTTERA